MPSGRSCRLAGPIWVRGRDRPGWHRRAEARRAGRGRPDAGDPRRSGLRSCRAGGDRAGAGGWSRSRRRWPDLRRARRLGDRHPAGLRPAPSRPGRPWSNASRAIAGMAPRPRRALVGYAHVPWPRQEAAGDCASRRCPTSRTRLAQFGRRGRNLPPRGLRGYRHGSPSSGQDPPLDARGPRRAPAAKTSTATRRARVDAQIGFGAGAISQFRQGYVQNRAADAVPTARPWPAAAPRPWRGVALTLEDKVRARAIDMLMCSFRIDLARDPGRVRRFRRACSRTAAMRRWPGSGSMSPAKATFSGSSATARFSPGSWPGSSIRGAHRRPITAWRSDLSDRN
jgi:hypothetical protein